MSKRVFADIYDEKDFRKHGHQTIDILAQYLHDSVEQNFTTVLPHRDPQEVLRQWQTDFATDEEFDLESFFARVLAQGNKLHHPKYMGHQVSSPLPKAALAYAVAALANNVSPVFEMAPVSNVMERISIQWLAQQIGYNAAAEGFFTSGGTLGNLTALLAARQAKAGYDVWNEGLASSHPLAVLVSGQSHYSIQRAIGVMGLGKQGVIPVAADADFKMDINDLERQYREATIKGFKVFAVAANACSTATGSYDDLCAIADFCQERDLWLHVDGAHGATALLSQKYRYLCRGIERADSVIWDMHKMMTMPALLTAVIFKEGSNSYKIFDQKEASYILEEEDTGNWWDIGLRSLECTRPAMGFEVYSTLKAYGKEYFNNYIEYIYDLSRWFADTLERSGLFEVLKRPQSNIICFRYTAKKGDLDQIQQHIRNEILASEEFYLVKAEINGKFYLRITLINPLTSKEDLLAFMEKIAAAAK
ncbi:MAG: pyridoxal phosphate-dependent decarboxylase family protein [Bacillota bacterium]|jgi:L-2,4-diaminobutyrate decarboxylase